MTQLEVEAQNLVNDIASTGSDHDCNDENRYASLLAQRKDRMSVSQ